MKMRENKSSIASMLIQPKQRTNEMKFNDNEHRNSQHTQGSQLQMCCLGWIRSPCCLAIVVEMTEMRRQRLWYWAIVIRGTTGIKPIHIHLTQDGKNGVWRSVCPHSRLPKTAIVLWVMHVGTWDVGGFGSDTALVVKHEETGGRTLGQEEKEMVLLLRSMSGGKHEKGYWKNGSAVMPVAGLARWSRDPQSDQPIQTEHRKTGNRGTNKTIDNTSLTTQGKEIQIQTRTDCEITRGDINFTRKVWSQKCEVRQGKTRRTYATTNTHKLQAKSKAKQDVSVGTKEENSNVKINGREQPRRNLTSTDRKLKHHRMKTQRKIPQEKSTEKQEQRKSN